jgi:hypothetical protein
MSYAFVEDVAAAWGEYERFAAALAGPAPPGLIFHAAGPTDEGFRIIELWESEEACRQFLAERHGPAASAPAYRAPVVRELRPAHIVYGKMEERQ